MLKDGEKRDLNEEGFRSERTAVLRSSYKQGFTARKSCHDGEMWEEKAEVRLNEDDARGGKSLLFKCDLVS